MRAALTTRTTAERDLLQTFRRVTAVSPAGVQSILQWVRAIDGLVGLHRLGQSPLGRRLTRADRRRLSREIQAVFGGKGARE
jgi:hypothetical protein